MTKKEPKFVDIYPLKKSHRILVWVGDFFINFICAILFFNIAVFPITKAIVNYDDIKIQMSNCQDEMMDVLYENKVLFYEDNELHYFDDNLVTTNDDFVAYHVRNQASINNCFYNYYTLIKQDPSGLLKLYSLNSGPTFFDLEILDANGVPTLKDKYAIEFSPLYIEGDALSENAKTDYESFSSLFLKYYDAMLDDVLVSDLTYQDMSYINLNKEVNEFVTQLDNYIVTAGLISYFLSVVILYMVVPLFSLNKRKITFGANKQTITERIMKIHKVGQDTLRLLPKSEIFLQAIYSMFSNLTLLVIVVVPSITITYAFSLNLLVFLSAFGLLYDLVGLLFILFNQYNKSLTDTLTKVILLENADLLNIVRTKGNRF